MHLFFTVTIQCTVICKILITDGGKTDLKCFLKSSTIVKLAISSLASFYACMTLWECTWEHCREHHREEGWGENTYVFHAIVDREIFPHLTIFKHRFHHFINKLSDHGMIIGVHLALRWLSIDHHDWPCLTPWSGQQRWYRGPGVTPGFSHKWRAVNITCTAPLLLVRKLHGLSGRRPCCKCLVSRFGMTLARNLPKTDSSNGVPLWLSQDCLFLFRSYNWTMTALLKSWVGTSLLQKNEKISDRIWVTISPPAYYIYAGMASVPRARCLTFFWDALEFTTASNKDFLFDTDVALTW